MEVILIVLDVSLLEFFVLIPVLDDLAILSQPM